MDQMPIGLSDVYKYDSCCVRYKETASVKKMFVF